MGFNAAGYLALWSLVGAFLFSLFVVGVFRTGFVYSARNEDGRLKTRMPVRGYLAMSTIPVALLGLMVGANYVGLDRQGVELGFGWLFLLNLAHYLILFLYDTLVIDYLVLIVWRPAFLRLSNRMTAESMGEHIGRSWLVGTAAGVVLSLLVTAVSTFWFLGA